MRRVCKLTAETALAFVNRFISQRYCEMLVYYRIFREPVYIRLVSLHIILYLYC